MSLAVLEAPAASRPPSAAPARRRRRIGRYSAGRPGPTCVLVGAIHGNEPAGAEAIANVLERLRREQMPLRGQLLGLVGNRAALTERRRFLARDLNRNWTPDSVRDAVVGAARVPEDDEQLELLREFAPLLASATEPVVFLDLHSTSGDGPPFTCMADVVRNRPIALALPIPLILGIEETVDGSLTGYLTDLGHVALAVEGGRNDDPQTVSNLETVIWIALTCCGALAASDVPDLAQRRERLARAAAKLPAVLEIRHRHPVREDDGFVMAPGFASFEPVSRGQRVADDRGGAITAPESGLMLMPRYQGQGEDGYFLAAAVSPFWLRLSAWLRRARLDRVVAHLPGVHRHHRDGDRLVVDPRVARWQVRNIFHLFGYRHERAHGESLVFSRRRPAFRGAEFPAELEGLAPMGTPRS